MSPTQALLSVFNANVLRLKEEEEDEDNMEEIDLDNIVGSRTRGKQIDYAKAAEEAKDELEDEDEEDDDDFEEPDDAMQE